MYEYFYKAFCFQQSVVEVLIKGNFRRGWDHNVLKTDCSTPDSLTNEVLLFVISTMLLAIFYDLSVYFG